ncbi:hypothetical protein DRN97_07830 [Methanosarcinales archaeon]|nr:MAG: hypothetical protein DRN97_07830 [Methanosarcinales archaeon]
MRTRLSKRFVSWIYRCGNSGNSPDAISVGAVDKYNYWACFSSGGYVNDTIIKPDVVAPGMNINSSILGASSQKST